MVDILPLASVELVTVQIFPKEIPDLSNERLLPLSGLSAPQVTTLVTVVDKLSLEQREAFAHKAANTMGNAFNASFKRNRLEQYISDQVYEPLKDNLSPQTVAALREEVVKPTNNNLSVLTSFLLAPDANQSNARIRLWNLMLETMTKAALQQGILTIGDLKKDDLYLSAALSQSYPLLFRPKGYEGKTVVEAMCEIADEFTKNPDTLKFTPTEAQGRKPIEIQRREHTQRLSAWTKEERKNLDTVEGAVNIEKLRAEIDALGQYEEYKLRNPKFGQLKFLNNKPLAEKKAAVLAILEPEKGLYYQIPEHEKSIYLLSAVAALCQDLPGEYKQLLALALCQEDRGLTTAVSTGQGGHLVMSTGYEGYDVTILRNADPEIRSFVHDFLLALVEKTYETTNIDPEGEYAHPAVQLSNLFLLTRPSREDMLRLFDLWDKHPDIDHLASLFSDQSSRDKGYIPHGLTSLSSVEDQFSPDYKDFHYTFHSAKIDLLNVQEVSDRFMKHLTKMLNTLTTADQRTSVMTLFFGYAFRGTRILPGPKYKAGMLEFWIKNTPDLALKAGYTDEVFLQWQLDDLSQHDDWSQPYRLISEKAAAQAAEWRRKSDADTAVSMHLEAGADMRRVIEMQMTLLEQREDFRKWLAEERAEFQKLYDRLPTDHRSRPQSIESEVGELRVEGYDKSLRKSLKLDNIGWYRESPTLFHDTERILTKENVTHQHVVEAMSDLHNLADKDLLMTFTQPEEKQEVQGKHLVRFVFEEKDIVALPLDRRETMASQLERIHNFLSERQGNPVFKSLLENGFDDEAISTLCQRLRQEKMEIDYLSRVSRDKWVRVIDGYEIIFTMRAIEARREDLGVRIETSPDTFQAAGARSYQLLKTTEKYVQYSNPVDIREKIAPVSLKQPLKMGMRVYISGPNGSGKTEAVRALLAAQYIVVHEGTPLADYVMAYVPPNVPKDRLAQGSFGSATSAAASLFQANVEAAVRIAPSGVVGLDEPLVGAPTDYRTPLALASILRLGKGGAITFIPTHEAPDFYLLERILGISGQSESWMINPSTHKQMEGIGGSFGIEMAKVVGLPLPIIDNAYLVKDGLSANLETIDLKPVTRLEATPPTDKEIVSFISDESLTNLGFSGDPAETDNVIAALIHNALPEADESVKSTLIRRFWPQFKKALPGGNEHLAAIIKSETEPIENLRDRLNHLSSSVESLEALEIDQVPAITDFFGSVKENILKADLYHSDIEKLGEEVSAKLELNSQYDEVVSQLEIHLGNLRSLGTSLETEEQKEYMASIDRIGSTLKSAQFSPENYRKQAILRLKQSLEENPKLFNKERIIKDFNDLFAKSSQLLEAVVGKDKWEEVQKAYQSSDDLSGIYEICEKLGSLEDKLVSHRNNAFYSERPALRIYLAVRSIAADRKSAIINALSRENKEDIEFINNTTDELVFYHISAANTRPDSTAETKFTQAKEANRVAGELPLQFQNGINMALDNALREGESKTRYKPQTMLPAKADSVDNHYQYTPDINILAITGVNAGGKSQSLRLAGQMAVLGKVYDGRVPASEATIAKDIPYVFAAINTARTGEGRSTFFNEMHSVLGMYQEFVSAGCPKGALILYDEPANGTSKDEKVALTVSILHSLEQMGATVIITNHESDVYKAMDKVRTNGDELKYYPVAYQYTDNPEKKYVLQHGMVGGSESAKIALEKGMSKEEVELAEFMRKTYREFHEQFVQ